MLDAGGWAVNTRAKISITSGRSLTSMAKLPEGAERSLTDPYADKEQPWLAYLLLLTVVGAAGYFWYSGDLQAWLGLQGEATVESGAPAPAAVEPVVAP